MLSDFRKHANSVVRLISSLINILRPGQNGRHSTDYPFKHILLNEAGRISTFVPKSTVSNILALVHILDWRRPGVKQLFKPMMANLLTHVCVTRPQWAKLMA